MCGIVGYIGTKNATPILLQGLKRLEYRGYDSAGIAVIENGKIEVKKDKGRVSNLEAVPGINDLKGTIGIAHTRWATHGKPSKENSHPHTDMDGLFAVVHNGIIENYHELKENLIEKGYKFVSQTDTEIVPNLINYYYKQDKTNDDMKFLRAVRNACMDLKGSFALEIISGEQPDKMIVVRKDSPLVIGKGNGENYIASDIPAILSYTKDFYFLNDCEFAVLTTNNIKFYDTELKEIKKHREVTREQRSRSHIPVAAIVGYTNAGKSTLLNTLTGAGILAEDKLFATLDPTTRDLKLPSGQEILMTDTVGFIRKLPHHLIEAFRSTLEEARYADIILHVVDASNPQMDEQMHTVYETLQNLGVKDKPVITVFNKIDRMEDIWVPRDLHADYYVKISARTGEGITEFLQAVEAVLREQKVEIEALYPYKEAGKIQLIRKYGELQEEEYREDGIFVRAFVPAELYGQVRPEGVTPNNCL